MFLPSFLLTAAAVTSSGGGLPASGLPLVLVENRGQSPPGVLFEARAPGLTYHFEADGFRVVGDGGAELAFRLEGACAARVEGVDRQRAEVHFLRGSGSVRGAPTYGGVVYRGIRPGVDLVVRVDAGRLEYDLHLDPRTSVEEVVLRTTGARELRLEGDGSLVVDGAFGPLRHRPPSSWQVRPGGSREPLSSRFVLLGAGRFGFEVDGRDPSLPLVIDPVLRFRSYVGGGDADAAHGVVVDAEGAVYVAGSSESADFPFGAEPLDGVRGGREAVVFKLAPDGHTLVFATFLGGERDDEAFDVAVDREGGVFVVGRTRSEDFPVTGQAWQRFPRGLWDAFAVKLSADGSKLVYSSLLGGSADDVAHAVAVDRSGSAYVVGASSSADFPCTDHALQRKLAGSRDGFVTKLDDQGSVAVFSTLLGGSRDDAAFAVDVDREGHPYVAGRTVSLDFPTTASAADTKKDELDGFVAKLGIDGAEMVWATFVGGTGEDEARGIDVGARNEVFVAGWTESTDFPRGSNSRDEAGPRGRDGFLARLSSSGATFEFSALIGGSGSDECLDVAVDRSGNAWVVGTTSSNDFPVTMGAPQAERSGATDGFAARLDPVSGGPSFATYFGSDGDDRLSSVDVERSWGHVAVGGQADAIPPSARGLLGVGAAASSDALLGAFGRVACSGEAARETLGGGCAVALTSTLPTLGNTLDVRIAGAAPNQRGALVVSEVRQEPVTLGPCKLFLDLRRVARAIPFATNELGQAEVSVPVPEHSRLCGAQFVLQAVVLAPQAGPLPFGQLTEAVRLTLGN